MFGPILSLRLVGILSIIVGVFCNASAGIFARTITDNGDISIIIASMYRFFISVPLILAFLFITKHKFSVLTIKDMFFIVIGGILFGSGVVAYNNSFLYTTIANANLFSNLLPFAVVPLSAMLYGEKINAQFLLAVFITVLGVILLIYDFSATGSSYGNMVGNIIAFFSMVLYAFYLVIVSGMRRKFSASELMFYMSLFAGISILVYGILAGEVLIPTSSSTMYSLLGLAFITHLFGAVVIAFGAGFVSASMTSILIMLQPVAGIIYGLLFYSEMLSLQEFTGILIAIFGVIYAQRSAENIRQ